MRFSSAVLILCQPHETAVTALTLRHLLHEPEPTSSIHVLMNGGFPGELRAIAPSAPSVTYYSSPTNLGVAGGRNFLLRLPEVRACDVIVILDNDVITPPQQIARLVAALADDPGAGVIGPAIIDLRAVAPSLGLDDGDLDQPITNDQLAKACRDRHDEQLWFHLGTHPDWMAVYLDEVPVERQLLRGAGADVDPFPAMNHHDPAIRSALAVGDTSPILASNVAGCCQAFRRQLLDEIGPLVDEFSPYGYEDVEFCIRAVRAGRRNYVVPNILMLHGTDRRHIDRRSPAAAMASQRNFMRCKSLLAWRHANEDWRAVAERSILRRYLLARQTGRHRGAAEQLRAHVAGTIDAERQIRHAIAAGSAPR